MEHDILEAFSNIPSAEILKIARNIQKDIVSGSSSVRLKDKNQLVTDADLKIQKFILQYFANSSLAGKYSIQAEEELNSSELALNDQTKPWQLIIDPIDGTTAFSKGKDTWGSMIGLCNQKGQLVYSWNLLSSGEIFQSGIINQLPVKDTKPLRVDVYSYEAGVTKLFPSKFESISLGKYCQENIITKSYPAAILAGWELYSGKLDALLWLPSSTGKGFYPNYDLIFLGVLREQGWKIAFSKQQRKIQMLAIAPTSEDLDLLWNTGLEMIDKTNFSKSEYETDIIFSSSF